MSDPVTAVTDFVLAATGAGLGVHLLLVGRRSARRSVRLAGESLLVLAAAAATGGIWHGFEHDLGPATADLVWLATLLLLGGGSAVLVLAVAHAVSRRAVRRAAIVVFVAVALYAVAALVERSFVVGVAGCLAALAGVTAMALRLWSRERAPAGPWLLAAVAVTLAGSAVQQSGFDAGRVDADDVYHGIQLVATVLLHRGALLLRDATARPMGRR